MRTISLLCSAVLLLAGCTPDQQQVQAQASQPATLTVVDSIFPMDVMISRFQAEAPRRPVDLGAAPTSQEALVEALVNALADSSAPALRALTLDLSEYAYLYFPTSAMAGEPYRQPPAVAWMLTGQNGEKGIQRLLATHGGKRLALAGVSCVTESKTEGDNRLWSDCRVRLKGDPTFHRLFGTIIQRGGRFKFVSLANDL